MSKRLDDLRLSRLAASRPAGIVWALLVFVVCVVAAVGALRFVISYSLPYSRCKLADGWQFLSYYSPGSLLVCRSRPVLPEWRRLCVQASGGWYCPVVYRAGILSNAITIPVGVRVITPCSVGVGVGDDGRYCVPPAFSRADYALIAAFFCGLLFGVVWLLRRLVLFSREVVKRWYR